MVRPTPSRSLRLASALLACVPLVSSATHARAESAAIPAAFADNPLERTLGRAQVRVVSAPFPIPLGRTVWELDLAARLEALGYQRVQSKPDAVGQYFWGHETFWIFRRAHRVDGRDHDAELFGLSLERSDGRVAGFIGADDSPWGDDHADPWLEPELLSESLEADRAVRDPVPLDELPEVAWRALLAAEDARFFDHPGLDAKGIARALLANIREGRIAQGGSTITQQLVKMRDLSPERTLSRKMSEAVRALSLEAGTDKDDVLESYLNHVYYGHVDGLAVHGVGAASRVFFSKDARELELHEAAVLAGIIQAPNRLSPLRHPERARERRDWVLRRMDELDWATGADVAAATRRPLQARSSRPVAPPAPHYLDWVSEEVEDEAGRRLERGRGVIVETRLDAHLQRQAQAIVDEHLALLRRDHRHLRSKPLAAALVAIDVETGDVIAHVGGPSGAGGFDRARQARRQPGSTVKPLLMLDAFDSCSGREPLTPASRILDEPLTLDLPSGPWTPRNSDGTFHGVVTAREALSQSLNVPFVRVARWCGFEQVAARLRTLGLPVPDDPPPAFALGAVEVSPLELVLAYSAFATPGRLTPARCFRRVEKPKGRAIERVRPRAERVSRRSSAFLVRDLLRTAVEEGTARTARIEGLDVAAKTGTSSERRDAWLVGHAGRVVAVVWVGCDDGSVLGLTGASGAAPAWRRFMERAVRSRPPRETPVPEDVVVRTVDERTGLRVGSNGRHARAEIFREGALPPRDRFWRVDQPVPVVR